MLTSKNFTVELKRRMSGTTTAWSTATLLSIFALVTMGCNPASSSQQARQVRVSICVTLDDAPLKDARVALIPKTFRTASGVLIPLATGLTDQDGCCVLKSADREYVTSADYSVVISQPLPLNEWAKQRFLPPRASTGRVNLFANPRDVVPSSYNIHSQLIVTVPNDENDFTTTIELQSRCP